MGRQSLTFNKETHVESRGKMKLTCLVESQRPTGRPGRPNPQEMCANTMEFFMDLGWLDQPMMLPALTLKHCGSLCSKGGTLTAMDAFLQKSLPRCGKTWGWADQWRTFSIDLTGMEMVALSLKSGGGL